MNVRYINPALIEDHPKNIKLYGQPDLDEVFLTSIERDGILSPLVVVPLEDDRYRCISGHRRKAGAVKLGLPVVPCVLREGLDDDAQIKLLLHLNRNRQKTEPMLVAEIEQYHLVLIREGRERSLQNLKIGENEKTSRGHPTGALGKSESQLADAFGLSRRRVRDLLTVYGWSSAVKFHEECAKEGIPAVTVSAAMDRWAEIQQDRMADRISLTRAASMIAVLKAETLRTQKAKSPLAGSSTSRKFGWTRIDPDDLTFKERARIVAGGIEVQFGEADTPDGLDPCIRIGDHVLIIDHQTARKYAGEATDGTA